MENPTAPAFSRRLPAFAWVFCLALLAAPASVWAAPAPEPETPRFSQEEYRIAETQKTATLWVVRDSAETARTVNYSTNDVVSFPQSDGASGVATPQADYKPVSGTLKFAKGDKRRKSFKITIVDDKVKENEESIFLTLTDDTGVLDATRLRITSNETLPAPPATAAPAQPPGGAAPAPPGTPPAGGPPPPGSPGAQGASPSPTGTPDPAATASPDASPAAGKALSVERLRRNPAALGIGGAGLAGLVALAIRALRKSRLGA